MITCDITEVKIRCGEAGSGCLSVVEVSVIVSEADRELDCDLDRARFLYSLC